MLAGVSLTWYTWLEQGRRINASNDVLLAIGRALRLDDAGLEHLLSLTEPGHLSRWTLPLLANAMIGAKSNAIRNFFILCILTSSSRGQGPA